MKILVIIKEMVGSLKRIMRDNKRLPREKEQYTITEIFPSKTMMENVLKMR